MRGSIVKKGKRYYAVYYIGKKQKWERAPLDGKTGNPTLSYSRFEAYFYLHAAPDRNKRAVENLRLDGTTQAEIDREKGHTDEDIGQAAGV